MKHITTPAEAEAARVELAGLRRGIEEDNLVLSVIEAGYVQAADAKNAEARAAQVVLRCDDDARYQVFKTGIAEATFRVARLEAALLRYAEERSDRMRDLRERELAARLTEVQP